MVRLYYLRSIHVYNKSIEYNILGDMDIYGSLMVSIKIIY